eukprot:g36173.t1
MDACRLVRDDVDEAVLLVHLLPLLLSYCTAQIPSDAQKALAIDISLITFIKGLPVNKFCANCPMSGE